MTDPATDDQPVSVRWLPTSTGHATGWLAVVVAAVLAVLAVAGPLAWWGLGTAAVVGWLAWAAMLRPRIGLTADALVLRGIVSTTWIPLGRIRTFTIRQVMAVWVGEQRFVSPAVGRSRRRAARPRQAARGQMQPGQVQRGQMQRGQMHESDAVEDAICAAMGDSIGSATPVTRTWAWPEIALGAGALVLFVVLLFV